MENVNSYSVKVTLHDLKQALENGLHTDAICRQFGISRQGLHSRCNRHGLAHLLKANRKKSIKYVPKLEFLVDGWMLQRNEYKELVSNGAISAYRHQKKSAYYRGISWEITFKEWWELWQSSGKWSQRGKTKGCFVMARNGDVGPYKIGNVLIQTHGENAITAQSHAKKDKNLEKKGVFYLYPNSKKPWLAKAGNKYLGYFETEEQAINARKKALQTFL